MLWFVGNYSWVLYIFFHCTTTTSTLFLYSEHTNGLLVNIRRRLSSSGTLEYVRLGRIVNNVGLCMCVFVCRTNESLQLNQRRCWRVLLSNPGGNDCGGGIVVFFDQENANTPTQTINANTPSHVCTYARQQKYTYALVFALSLWCNVCVCACIMKCEKWSLAKIRNWNKCVTTWWPSGFAGNERLVADARMIFWSRARTITSTGSTDNEWTTITHLSQKFCVLQKLKVLPTMCTRSAVFRDIPHRLPILIFCILRGTIRSHKSDQHLMKVNIQQYIEHYTHPRELSSYSTKSQKMPLNVVWHKITVPPEAQVQQHKTRTARVHNNITRDL